MNKIKNIIKYVLKLIFYTTVGVFYRKDLRKIDYYIDEYGIAVLVDNLREGYIAEDYHDVFKRIKNTDGLSLKDKLNFNRLKFGRQIDYKNNKLVNWIKAMFLTELYIGKVCGEIWTTGFPKNTISYRLLKILKLTVDYSYQNEINEL